MVATIMTRAKKNGRLIFETALTPGHDCKIAALNAEVRNLSKASFERIVANYQRSTSQTLGAALASLFFFFSPLFCPDLAFNVAAINHNKISAARRFILLEIPPNVSSAGIPERHANREARPLLAQGSAEGQFSSGCSS